MKKTLNEKGKAFLEMYMNCYDETLPKSVREVYKKKLLDMYDYCGTYTHLAKKMMDKEGFKKFLLYFDDCVKTDLELAYDALLFFTQWIESNGFSVSAKIDKKRKSCKNIILTQSLYMLKTPYSAFCIQENGECREDVKAVNSELEQNYNELLKSMEPFLNDNEFKIKFIITKPHSLNMGISNAYFIIPVKIDYSDNMMNWLQTALAKLSDV